MLVIFHKPLIGRVAISLFDKAYKDLYIFREE